jgi:hypothetical protein
MWASCSYLFVSLLISWEWKQSWRIMSHDTRSRMWITEYTENKDHIGVSNVVINYSCVLYECFLFMSILYFHECCTLNCLLCFNQVAFTLTAIVNFLVWKNELVCILHFCTQTCLSVNQLLSNDKCIYLHKLCHTRDIGIELLSCVLPIKLSIVFRFWWLNRIIQTKG